MQALVTVPDPLVLAVCVVGRAEFECDKGMAFDDDDDEDDNDDDACSRASVPTLVPIGMRRSSLRKTRSEPGRAPDVHRNAA